MAYAPARSCNAEFNEGATDGGMRKDVPNRGGFNVAPGTVYPTKPMVCVLNNRGDQR